MTWRRQQPSAAALVKFNCLALPATSPTFKQSLKPSIDFPPRHQNYTISRQENFRLFWSRLIIEKSIQNQHHLPLADRGQKLFSGEPHTHTSTSQQQRHRKDNIEKKMSGFKPVELFGGAITADFPATFGDVRYALFIFHCHRGSQETNSRF